MKNVEDGFGRMSRFFVEFVFAVFARVSVCVCASETQQKFCLLL